MSNLPPTSSPPNTSAPTGAAIRGIAKGTAKREATSVTLRMLTYVAILIIMFSGAVMGWGVAFKVMGPGPLPAAVDVVVPKGSSYKDTAKILQAEGVVDYWWAWWLMARYAAPPGVLHAGEYAIPARASLWDVLDIMRKGEVIVHKITIPEGKTSAEIIALLKREDLLEGEVDQIPPEGSLLPETYHYQRGDTRADIIARMQVAMDVTLNELWAARAPNLPYNEPLDAVTMASIVEKETGMESERATVAGVYVNRLRKGMKLQSDPTTIYALTGGKGSIQDVLGRQLVRSDWKLANPYNTYHVTGLPPGPIANPGRASLLATLKPAQHDYLFFVADGTGGHVFTTKLDDHNRHVNKRREEKKQEKK
jgi:UPF0755 protein